MDEESLPEYLGEVRRLQKAHRDGPEIYLGLEVDYLSPEQNPAEAKYHALGVDYLIGSVHHIYSPEQEAFIPVDSTREELDRLAEETFGGDTRSMVGRYYQMLREMIRIGGFDIIGHIDLIKKHNADNRYFDEAAGWYRDEIEETLRVIADLGETAPLMEVNTGAMARGYTAEPYPSPWILERGVELGIPIMLNADAHKPEWIDYGFPEVERIIRDAGYASRWILLNGEWREVAYE
jgi:histidinol-phosphatase (PHP family)